MIEAEVEFLRRTIYNLRAGAVQMDVLAKDEGEENARLLLSMAGTYEGFADHLQQRLDAIIDL